MTIIFFKDNTKKGLFCQKLYKIQRDFKLQNWTKSFNWITYSNGNLKQEETWGVTWQVD